MSPEDKEIIITKIKQIESEVLDNSIHPNIKAWCDDALLKSNELRNSTDSLTPVLRASFSSLISDKKSRESHYNHFKSLCSDITTLSELKSLMDKTEPQTFCEKYLDLKVTKIKLAGKTQKYLVFKELTDGFLAYKEQFGFLSEIAALRHWSLNINRRNLKNDFIGKRPGIGPAVINNIRLQLGDRELETSDRAFEVIQGFFGLYTDRTIYISSEDAFAEVADAINVDPEYLDCLLNRFGAIHPIYGALKSYYEM